MELKPASDKVVTTTGKVRPRLIRPIATDYDNNWRSLKFWRNAFLIYWIFSLVGHILELIWVNLPLLVGQPPTNVLPLFVVAAPYGFGALALIWVVYPLVKNNKASALTVFVISCFWAFPIVNNFINWFDRKAHKLLNALTAILFVVYMTIQVMFVTGNPPSKVFNLPRPYFDIGGVCEEDGPCPPPKEKLSGWPK